ncbi:hypothetical protein Fmac_019304 [Flemingia macrophylla]|uniref:Uncharacterized protein n=1 Tax=Flemingia macrophylla TaxID=520843 RepID=A0ABD1M7F4_9FABA
MKLKPWLDIEAVTRQKHSHIENSYHVVTHRKKKQGRNSTQHRQLSTPKPRRLGEKLKTPSSFPPFSISLPKTMIFNKGSMHSNLDCFVRCTTPVVQSQFLPKSEITSLNRLWHPWERETVEYFTLGDLWNCYDEWSAYGAGVPITLTSGETLVQYYVPYLSAIQIFASNSFRMLHWVIMFVMVKLPRGFHDVAFETWVVVLLWFLLKWEEIESGDCETRDSYSDSFSDESECDKLWRWDGTSSEEGGSEQDSLWHFNDRLGHLYCQYFERATPYGRVPLMDKITGLAQRYPGLMSFRSVDLSPASWMAVAWYPIYHIPMGRTIKDLSTCFLTYHTLSSSFQGMDLEDDVEGGQEKKKEGEGIALPAFGLATYKMQGGNVWMGGNYGRDQERLISLLSVADSWLKQLRVQHHDFNHFIGIRHG